MILMPSRRGRFLTFKKPIVGRCSFACALLLTGDAFAEGRVLDRVTVAQLANERAPSVIVAERTTAEARALHVGAGIPAQANPEISAFVGPRWQNPPVSVDFFVGVSIPFDVSGAPSQRRRVADERTRVAESAAEVTKRSAVADALSIWARARGAEERAKLEDARLALDRSFVHAAEVRRTAGTAGDGDVALAHVLEAQGIARRASAEHERDALVERLRARVGLAGAEPVVVAGTIEPEDALPIEALLARLPQQPAIVRAKAATTAAASDEALQRKLGTPVPRATGGTGQDPQSYVHFGLDVPIPLYQRNQTNIAVAGARVQTARAEQASAVTLAEADLRAAYAEYVGARDAFRALLEALPHIDGAEHLAQRSYELGQSTLAEVLAARREAATARLALLEARVNLALSRIAVDALAGTLP